jgi:asparagine synthase (glutamine-hydrolysing)
MCGISGFFGSCYSSEQLRASSVSIAHRGPDGYGIFEEDEVGLAHRRLSIIDLSEAGAQPYYYENLVLVFNGELYNYKEVQLQLVAEGYSFQSHSDTEVLIKAFHCWGVQAIERFTGMFAFALYQRDSKELFLFRDRLGVKPLYYSTEKGIAFGSELKALLPFLFSKAPDLAAVREYFRHGYITGEKSIFKAVKNIPAGHYLHFKNGEAILHSYWSLKTAKADHQKTEAEWEEELHKQLIDAFRLRMVADVPVGVFLSGGIDSSLVTAILQQHHGNIHTFTIGFDDERFNEAPYAREVARHLGTTHTEFELRANDAYPLLEKFYDIYDEPFADSSGIPSTMVSRLAAREGIKVVLSADGGDELFAGYPHYNRTMQRWQQWSRWPYFLRNATGGLLGTAYQSGLLKKVYTGNTEHRLAAVSELLRSKDISSFFDATLANQAEAELDRLVPGTATTEAEIYPADALLTILQLRDLNLYLTDDLLVKMDRATMYNSIEGREPFLDHRLVEMAFRIPASLKWRDGKGKYILRKILSRYIPESMIDRPKKGFSIPLFRWFSEEMGQLFSHYFTNEKLKQVPLLNNKEVMHEYRKYQYYQQQGKEYNIEKMWRILSFMLWWEKWYIEKSINNKPI